jgi:hypothetical protein
MSDRTTRLAGLYAVVAAGVAVVVSPLLALSYFATGDGAEELEIGTVAAWADPARDLASGLLTWASPDRVYGLYWLVFWALFAAVFFCARAVHALRPPDISTLERWGWRLALVGYGLGTVGSVTASVVIIEGSAENAWIDVVFLAVMVPALAIDAIGSTVLGVALLRSRYQPRATAWLLVLVLPSIAVIPELLGNLSLGLLPVYAAWAVTGWRLWRSETVANLDAAAAR